MYFGSTSREGFSEEEIQMGKGKFPFSYTSSSSPSSSSSSHQPKTQLLGRLGNSPWENHQIYDIHGHPMSCSNSWLGNRYEPKEVEEDNEEATVTAATAAIEAEDTKRVVDEDSDSNPNEPRSASAVKIEKEHMFDKVVTPSDVGKLNRLVIPKQHAEKYFPLDSSANVKGLLLNFEDRNGKPWRFRYSYWNSSQSYVITKGWSRFVKDKKLDAGDVVSFQRVVGEGEAGKDRLFIDWKRRPNIVAAEAVIPFHQQYHLSNLHRSSVPWSPLLMPPPQSTGSGGVVYPRGAMGSVFYLRSAGPQMGMGMGIGMMEWEHQGGGGGGVVEPIVFDSVPVVQGKAAAKRLRLFGVNMECPISESEEASNSQPPQLISSSTTSSQLRLYNGTPLPPIDFLNANKGKASISFDLDM